MTTKQRFEAIRKIVNDAVQKKLDQMIEAAKQRKQK